jgi:hypothetical protein
VPLFVHLQITRERRHGPHLIDGLRVRQPFAGMRELGSPALRFDFVSHAQNSVSNGAAMRIRFQPDCENGMPQGIVFASFQ